MFELLLGKISKVLDEAAIPYMIIGGQAVLLYGEPRLTRDIDVTLGATVEQLWLVLDVARRIGLEPLVDPETFTKKTMVLPCQEPDSGIRVDFIFSSSSYEKQAMERVRTVLVRDVPVKFASLEDLVVHKIIAGRPRDMEDARSVLLKNPHFDAVYVRRWLSEFGNALGEALVQRFEKVVGELG